MKPKPASLANLRPFEKGNAGRPRGSRNKLGEAFLQELFVDFEANGAAAIVRCREEDPAAYVRVIASLMPKEMKVEQTPFADLTDADLERRIEELNRAIWPERYGPGSSGTH